jgi:hypothetical protein
METTIQEPTLVATGKVRYGILDNECGTLVDRHDNECGDFGFDTKTVAGKELQVVSIVSTHNDKKALHVDKKDAEHVKWLLEQENPDISYSLVSFTEYTHTFYSFETVE